MSTHSTYPSPAPLGPFAVGAGSITALASRNPTRTGLYIFNTSSTATLWIATAPIVATVGGSGCIAIQPLQGLMLGPPTMSYWTNNLNGIASAGTINATVLEFYP